MQYFTSIAPLYAKALFDYALEIEKLDSIATQVARIKAVILQESSIIKEIAAPVYSDKEQGNLLKKLAQVLNLSKEMNNLLDILAKHKRLSSLEEILNYFEVLLNNHLGKKVIEVIVAQDISLKAKVQIEEQLSELFAAKVVASFKQDPKILGGIIIKCENKMLDASLTNRFNHLSKAVKNHISQLELNK
jgi:F-type H+-transporting ATPase subunit delta